MAYASLEACLLDLEKNGHRVRIKEEVDPHLEMAAIHLRVHEAGGPALFFENVKDRSIGLFSFIASCLPLFAPSPDPLRGRIFTLPSGLDWAREFLCSSKSHE